MTRPSAWAGSAAARRLALPIARKVDGMLHGDHLGFQAGPGGELADARAYVPGDDVRRLDWAVLARTGLPHVRTTTAERELETTLVVDLSASMGIGTRVQTKRELALVMAGAFAHLASGPGDRLSAVVATTAGLRTVPPRPTSTAGAALLSMLERIEVTDGAAPSLADALHAVPLRRRGLVVVVSDLLGGPTSGEPAWQRPLRAVGLRHEVVVVHVLDPHDLQLPAVGLLRLVDAETGRALDVPTGDARLRRRYAEAAERRRSATAAAVRAAGAEYLEVRTDGDWLRSLGDFVQRRRRARRPTRAVAR